MSKVLELIYKNFLNNKPNNISLISSPGKKQFCLEFYTAEKFYCGEIKTIYKIKCINKHWNCDWKTFYDDGKRNEKFCTGNM